ncbi:hypothetical protein Pcac1_g29405 [Phytophthora cactorum]|nr:hypothetical protein Pcac1_g29405 [Phytophthora cactorum]
MVPNTHDGRLVAVGHRKFAFVPLNQMGDLALSLQMWCVAPLSTAHIPDTFLPVETPHSSETANATRS